MNGTRTEAPRAHGRAEAGFASQHRAHLRHSAPGWRVLARNGALALACFSLAACGKSETPSRPRGLTPTETPAPAPAPSQPPAPPPPPPNTLSSPFSANAPDPGALSVPADAAPSAPPAEAAVEDAGPQRDLAQELATLIGQPLSCINFPAAVTGGGKLVIAVDAQVVPSGRITRASVSAPGQPPEALQCIERIVTLAGLRGPVPGAPRRVSTSVTLQVVANPN